MSPQLISLKPKPAISKALKTSTDVESNPAYSDKTEFPTVARKDDWPVKRRPESESVAVKRKRDAAPIHIHRKPNYTRNTQRGHSARLTSGATRLPIVSRAFESKFHSLERNQKNLVQQTNLDGQLEYLTVSRSSESEL